jgi:hypothetical protein
MIKYRIHSYCALVFCCILLVGSFYLKGIHSSLVIKRKNILVFFFFVCA